MADADRYIQPSAHQLTERVSELSLLVAQLRQQIVDQAETMSSLRSDNQLLRDEVARLKGQKGKPAIKPSHLAKEPRSSAKGRGGKLIFPVFPPPQKNRSPPSDSRPETFTPGGMVRLSRTSSVCGSMRRSSLSSASQVPCQRSPSTQVTPVTKRLDSMVRRTLPDCGSIWWILRSRCWPTHSVPSAHVESRHACLSAIHGRTIHGRQRKLFTTGRGSRRIVIIHFPHILHAPPHSRITTSPGHPERSHLQENPKGDGRSKSQGPPDRQTAIAKTP